MASPQTAPVTSIGIVTDATTGTVTVPVTVTGFIDVGQFRLTLTYKTTCITYVSYTSNPVFTGITVTHSVTGTTGKLVIDWPGVAANYTMPDLTHILDISFNYITSTSYLSWAYVSPNICRYRTYSGGSYITLSDSPKRNFYKHGGIGDRGAPVTTAPVISNAVPGNIDVPVTVTDFNSIQAFNLALEYDQSVLTYQGALPNPALSGSFYTGSQMGPNGKMMVTVLWTGLSTLPDGSTLYTINFTYSNTNGSYSTLNWYDAGPDCEFSATDNKLIDMPAGDYYYNGLIFTQYAPKVWLPSITDAVPFDDITIPVQTMDFSDIYSFTLSYEYDTAALTYTGFTPDTALSGMTVVNNTPAGSKRKLVISWTGADSKSLPDGSSIATLDFTYKTASTDLAWVVNDATSCRFNDSDGHAYYDLPKSDYYTNGLVASQLAPLTAAWYASPAAGEQVIVPVKVYRFTNIGLFNLTLDYDPGVLTYQSALLVPSIGGTFTSSSPGAGRIIMGWDGTAASLPDESDLINLTFIYNGGASPLAWYDNGTSCRYAAGSTQSPYHDQPAAQFYVNGYIGPAPLVADFTASNVAPEINATVTLNDNATGGPTGWNWSISPGTYIFVNGTDASFQNPQVQFTSNGIYSVTLIVTRETSASVKVKPDYILAGDTVTEDPCGLWTGITSSDWFTSSNWCNYQVPISTTDVVIPASAPYWPHLTGDLTLGGSLCKNITLEGAAQMTIDGDLTINPGSSFTFTGSGILVLGGDWSDSGTFITGTSTIEFTGINDALLLGNAASETFYKIILSKNNAQLSLQGNVNVIGTENQ